MYAVGSKGKGDGKAKKNESVVFADRKGVFPESAPISRKAKVRAKYTKDNVATSARNSIPQESAPEAKKEESQKEREMVTKEMAKDRGVGAKAFGK